MQPHSVANYCCSHPALKSKTVVTVSNSYPVNVENFAKYLGISTADYLSRSQHINNVTAKANIKLGLLWRN